MRSANSRSSAASASIRRRSRAERVALQQDVGVVGDVGAGGAEVEDAAAGGGLLGEVAQMGDHVVAGLALELGDALEIEARGRFLEAPDLLFGDG